MTTLLLAPNEINDTNTQLTLLFQYSLCFGLLQWFCVIFTSPTLPFDKRFYRASYFLWFLLLPIMIVSAVYSVYYLSTDLQHRWLGTTTGSFLFIRLYIAINVSGTIGELLTWKAGRKADGTTVHHILILLHHILSISSYALGLTYGNNKIHYYGCLLGLCEIPTLFLTILIWSKFENNTTAQFLNKHCSAIFIINGCLLWVTYIIFRLLLFPYWMYSWVVDLQEYASMNEEGMRNETSTIILYSAPIMTILLFFASIVWFLRIHQGMVKLIKSGGTGMENDTNNDGTSKDEVDACKEKKNIHVE